MLHYFLTGDALSRETVLELARWTIDMDDGRKTIFRWLDRGPTGHATASARDYHGPGRASANCVTTLLNAHRLTGDAAFLDQAERSSAGASTPADDIDARDLLDAETRWFYTMFLQALGAYLDHKAERGELTGCTVMLGSPCCTTPDGWRSTNALTWRRPRSSSTRPRPGPPRTARKSDVFAVAARLVDGPERERFPGAVGVLLRRRGATPRCRPDAVARPAGRPAPVERPGPGPLALHPTRSPCPSPNDPSSSASRNRSFRRSDGPSAGLRGSSVSAWR